MLSPSTGNSDSLASAMPEKLMHSNRVARHKPGRFKIRLNSEASVDLSGLSCLMAIKYKIDRVFYFRE